MPVRLTALIRKLPSVSIEHFHEYWSKDHAKTFMSIAIVQKNVTKYSQFHIEHNVASKLAEAGANVAAYDGGAEIWGETYEDLLAIFQDEEYLRVVAPDEAKFFERDSVSLMIGYDEVKSEKGKEH